MRLLRQIRMHALPDFGYDPGRRRIRLSCAARRAGDRRYGKMPGCGKTASACLCKSPRTHARFFQRPSRAMRRSSTRVPKRRHRSLPPGPSPQLPPQDKATDVAQMP